jgi:hypothetical protein
MSGDVMTAMEKLGYSSDAILAVVKQMAVDKSARQRGVTAARVRKFRENERVSLTPVTPKSVPDATAVTHESVTEAWDVTPKSVTEASDATAVTHESVTEAWDVTPKSVTEPEPYKENRERARVCSNGSSFQSEPIDIKPTPLVLSKAKLKPAVRKSSLREDAQPSDADKRLASEAGVSGSEFRDEWRAFRDHHCSRGNLMKNWHLAWSTWLRNSRRFKARASPVNGQKYRNGHMELAVNEMREDYAKCNGNHDGKPVFDVEVFLGKKPREARPGDDGASLDARNDAEAPGELDFCGVDGTNLPLGPRRPAR